MPIAGILTGAVNQGAEYFAKRECMDVCLRGFNNKRDAWSLFLETFDVRPEEVAYVFDDVIDLPIAESCGLRVCVRRTSSPAFQEYVVAENLCDFITAHEGGDGAVRETCEFLLAVSGIYEKAVQVRIAYGDTYRRYIKQRKAINTRILLAEGVK
jgi:3-deoxy-D-manno-octulosonate 8-phosphate phosphatase (KDO 8-P phosphatase)